ncbi:MAG: helix-turn-helix domain-containing protein, partial [Limisphaerales bacterium]
RALRFIREHAREPIDIADVARVAAMSRRGLHLAFQQHVGRPPGEEIRRVRLEAAKRQLTETADKIETIGLDCGYQSLNSFCVAFKQATGMPPGEYRRQVTGVA